MESRPPVLRRVGPLFLATAVEEDDAVAAAAAAVAGPPWLTLTLPPPAAPSLRRRSSEDGVIISVGGVLVPTSRERPPCAPGRELPVSAAVDSAVGDAGG